MKEGNLADWVVKKINTGCLRETGRYYMAVCRRGQPRPEIVIRNPAKVLTVTIWKSRGWNIIRVFAGNSQNGPWREIYKGPNPWAPGTFTITIRGIENVPYLKFRLVDGDRWWERLALFKKCTYEPKPFPVKALALGAGVIALGAIAYTLSKK